MKNLLLLLSSLYLVALLTSPVAQADLYKWVDERGNIHYGDKPPENVQLENIAGNVSSFTSVNVEPFVFDPDIISNRSKSKSVVMYSTSWCGYCKKAASHFRKNKIPFTEYDIEKSARGARDYKRLKGRGVPIILIGDKRMNGFSAKTFDRIYYAKS
jgi:glutaredoxin